MMVGCRRTTKAEMVASVTNDLIAELIERSRRSEGIRDYYDVAVVGYSGDGVNSMLGHESYLSIAQIAQMEVEYRDVEREYMLSDGSARLFRHHLRSWIEAKACGSTPMYEALLSVNEIVEEWSSKEQNWGSFPPIIFNITDGESTDCDYEDIVEISSKIKAQATSDGEALLFNVHIASMLSKRSLLFPSLEEIAQWSESPRSAQSLYRAASPLPPLFREAFCDLRGGRYEGEVKAMSFNCSVSELVTLLNIGSISVKCR